LPGSFSFPSGHSASAFAFATGVGLEEPWLFLPILPLAAGVAYSRVHLRVHYPFDVLVGAAIGTGMGLASSVLIRAARQWWDPVTPVPATENAGTNQLILVVSPHAGHEHKLAQAKHLIAATGLEVVAELARQGAREVLAEDAGMAAGLLKDGTPYRTADAILKQMGTKPSKHGPRR